MNKNKLTQEKLKQLLHYDSETGVFRWRISPGRRVRAGDVAGSLNKEGYRYVQINRKLYRASRLAWLYVEGYFPENDIDHIDRIRNNDSWTNLRHVSHRCNMRNMKIAHNNKSGIAGVYWHKRDKKWNVQIINNYKQLFLGVFDNLIDAAHARWKAEKKYNWSNCCSTSSAYLYLKEQNVF